MKPQPQTLNRPLSQFSTAMLFNVVKQGKYQRYPVQLAQQLQVELALRRMEEKRRVN